MENDSLSQKTRITSIALKPEDWQFIERIKAKLGIPVSTNAVIRYAIRIAAKEQ